MVTEEFLDTNIIVNYVNHNENSKKIVKKTHDYVLEIKGKIILCGIVIKELNKLIERKSRIHKSVLILLENEEYDLSKNLSSREVPFAKKLYAKFKNFDKEKLSKIFSQERILFEIEIDKFLKFKVDKIVIPISEVCPELVSKIHNLIQNIDDCKVLASALQYQKQEESLFNFVTADAGDFFVNGYNDLKEHFEINYSKENWRFPELVNLMF
jgi:predicted nucleic acid-binding protein